MPASPRAILIGTNPSRLDWDPLQTPGGNQGEGEDECLPLELIGA